MLPQNATVCEVVDFAHLIGYLDDVVDGCDPEGDPHDMNGSYAPSC